MMRALLRLGAWGCGAVIALAATIIVGRSEVGAQRLQNALASVAVLEQSKPTIAPAVQPLAPEPQTDTLSAAVRLLASDRDRLLTRIVSLERNLADVTGSIPAAPVPVRRDPGAESRATNEVAASRVQFGVDLGGAPNMDVLQAQWLVAKANHARLLEGLRPLAGVAESKPGVPELRLIAGPFGDIAAATKLCAALTTLRTACRTAVFDGLKLAHNDVAATGAPAPVANIACSGNPNALGTSRVLAVGTEEFSSIGTMQYAHSLALKDHEVVLTFDDGPLPPYTNHVLAALAAECVKATYFMVGNMANAYPDAVRQVYNAGHTIGTHSQHHPYTLATMSPEGAAREINAGFASVGAALGDATAVAPFFRFPGLLRVKAVEKELAGRSIMTWSADLDADDWHKIAAAEVLRRALSRLEARGRGILLLHDIQPATALMLPALLRELKKRGYRIVQVVPSLGEPRKLLPVAASGRGIIGKQGWPRVATIENGEIVD